MHRDDFVAVFIKNGEYFLTRGSKLEKPKTEAQWQKLLDDVSVAHESLVKEFATTIKNLQAEGSEDQSASHDGGLTADARGRTHMGLS